MLTFWTLRDVDVSRGAGAQTLLSPGTAVPTAIACALSWARPASAPSCRCTCGCPTPWRAPRPFRALDPRRHDGDGGRLPLLPHQLPVRASARWRWRWCAIIGPSPRCSPPRSASRKTTSRRCSPTPRCPSWAHVHGRGGGRLLGGRLPLVTHAFFKACLFLGAGSVMHGNERRAGHQEDGRPAPEMPSPSDTSSSDAGHHRCAALRRLLLQRRDLLRRVHRTCWVATTWRARLWARSAASARVVHRLLHDAPRTCSRSTASRAEARICAARARERRPDDAAAGDARRLLSVVRWSSGTPSAGGHARAWCQLPGARGGRHTARRSAAGAMVRRGRTCRLSWSELMVGLAVALAIVGVWAARRLYTQGSSPRAPGQPSRAWPRATPRARGTILRRRDLRRVIIRSASWTELGLSCGCSMRFLIDRWSIGAARMTAQGCGRLRSAHLQNGVAGSYAAAIMLALLGRGDIVLLGDRDERQGST